MIFPSARSMKQKITSWNFLSVWIFSVIPGRTSYDWNTREWLPLLTTKQLQKWEKLNARKKHSVRNKQGLSLIKLWWVKLYSVKESVHVWSFQGIFSSLRLRSCRKANKVKREDRSMIEQRNELMKGTSNHNNLVSFGKPALSHKIGNKSSAKREGILVRSAINKIQAFNWSIYQEKYHTGLHMVYLHFLWWFQ